MIVSVDGAVSRNDRLLGLIAVVNRFELELAAIDAAGAIGFFECGEDAFAHTLAERLRRAI